MISFFAILLVAVAAHAEPEDSWKLTETPHFAVFHERADAVLGDYNRLEQIYEGLHRELWTLVPWMAQERALVYIYKDQESFLAGKFKPAAWSAGLFQAAPSKTVAFFEPVETTVAAHELTHLYLHSYFAEKGARPPAWLDEGLAGLLEGEALRARDPREKGPVLRSPRALAAFLKAKPGRDDPESRLSAWYAQAASVVWFIKRGHIEASFQDFCAALRAGKDAEAALRATYGYDDLAAFEKAWQAWRPKKPIGAPADLNSAD